MSDAEHISDDAAGTEYRAGFVSFVGRPNVGKSTLTNALVGEKVTRIFRALIRSSSSRTDTGTLAARISLNRLSSMAKALIECRDGS